jgi:hypothetical protein
MEAPQPSTHLLRFLPIFLIFISIGATVAQTDPERIDLTIGKAPAGDLALDWQDACSKAGTDYAVYEGDLGAFYSHSSAQCSSSGGTQLILSPLPGDKYYLVVPLESGTEGSYGLNSVGIERPAGTSTCLAQQILSPCLEDSFIDAGPLRVARLDTVLDSAASIIESGGTYTDVANMLAGEADVEGVYSNGVSLYFIVDGLPTSIYDGIAARHGGAHHEIIPPQNPLPPPVSRDLLESDPVPAGSVAPIMPRGQRMVGKDDNGDGFRNLPKHALILTPWAFDFAPNDSAPLINTILNGVQDYQMGSVTFKSNTTDLLTNTMQLSDYMSGWADKDIIFISSHGDADASAPFGPDPYILLGIGGSTCANIGARLKTEVPDRSTRPGLYCSVTIEIGPGPNPLVGRDTLGTARFFEQVHGRNLDKKLIFLDACRTAFTPGLAEALTGPDSVFFGWSEYVFTTTSVASSTALIKETVEDAFPALRSFVRECSGGACMDPPGNAPATLLGAWDRADLRTREALNIAATPIYGFCGVSATDPVSLTCPSCGGAAPISIIYNITVEGLEPQEMVLLGDPLEFAKYQLRLFADVDNIESGYAVVLIDQTMIPVGNGVYADLFGINLFMDDICPNQIIE